MLLILIIFDKDLLILSECTFVKNNQKSFKYFILLGRVINFSNFWEVSLNYENLAQHLFLAQNWVNVF